MNERKNLTITQVGQITSGDRRDGRGKWQSLSFRAKDGDKEYTYVSFRPNLFDAVKTGQTINADIETSTRERDGNTYTDRKVVQIYQDGQPVSSKGQWRGKSPEETQAIKAQVAVKAITEMFIADKLDALVDSQNYFAIAVKRWLETALIQDNPLAKDTIETVSPLLSAHETGAERATVIQDLTQFKGLMSTHKVATADVLTILSIGKLSEIKDFDQAWEAIKEAKGP